jgi:spore germination protein KC
MTQNAKKGDIMNFKPIIRKGKLLQIVISILSCLCLTGCWDLVEVNQLSIVNFVGLDRNPDSGKYTIFYQIINPAGIAAQKTSGINSPIYTYRLEASTAASVSDKMFEIIPRRPFFDHYQAMIVTERTAREGMEEVLDYFEKQPDRRATIYLFVTDDPLPDIMKTYIPLERLPGRAVRSIVESESKQSGQASRQSRIKDLVENMESSEITVLPFVSLSGKALPTTSRYEQIDANQGSIVLNGGAIFKQDRMVGKLKPAEMPWFYLLNGQIGVLYQSLTVNQDHVDVRATKTSVRKQISMISGNLVQKIDIDAKLHLVENAQDVKLSVRNLDEIKAEFNRQVSEKAYEFYEKAKRNEWDLLGIEQQIKRKRGKQWEDVKKENDIWRQTKLEITVNCTIDTVGNTIDPYKEKGGE